MGVQHPLLTIGVQSQNDKLRKASKHYQGIKEKGIPLGRLYLQVDNVQYE
jgi:hypothetical protein